MSSLLKALKQQQSPLFKQPSVLDASLMAKETRGRSGAWLLWPSVILLGGAIGAGSATWHHTSERSTSVTTTDFEWGEAEVIDTLSWEEQTPPAASKTEPSTGTAAADREARSEPQATPRTALDLSTVSPELLARFEAAVDETGGNGSEPQETGVIPPLNQLASDFQQRVPAFTYDSHMYRSSAPQRWIELGGQRLYEGDNYRQLKVLRIEPHQVVLVFGDRAFSQAALEDWQP